MAGGPFAAFVMCLHCGRRAARTSEGLEDDYYHCDACGSTFGIDWSHGQPTKPCWPPDEEQRAAFVKMRAMREGERDDRTDAGA